jgi:hypothetical protein
MSISNAAKWYDMYLMLMNVIPFAVLRNEYHFINNANTDIEGQLVVLQQLSGNQVLCIHKLMGKLCGFTVLSTVTLRCHSAGQALRPHGGRRFVTSKVAIFWGTHSPSSYPLTII